MPDCTAVFWEAKGSGTTVIIPASASSNFLVGAVIISALYFAREILVPIALAILLSFVLAPLVRFLQRLMPRSVAILGAVTIAMRMLASMSSVPLPRAIPPDWSTRSGNRMPLPMKSAAASLIGTKAPARPRAVRR